MKGLEFIFDIVETKRQNIWKNLYIKYTCAQVYISVYLDKWHDYIPHNYHYIRKFPNIIIPIQQIFTKITYLNRSTVIICYYSVYLYTSQYLYIVNLPIIYDPYVFHILRGQSNYVELKWWGKKQILYSINVYKINIFVALFE